MYCKNCGAQNQDVAKFCCKCGGALNKPAESVTHRFNDLTYYSYPTPQPYGGYPYPQYGDIRFARTTPMYWAAILLLTVAFLVSLFAPWIHISESGSYYPEYGSRVSMNADENMTYFDLFKDEDDLAAEYGGSSSTYRNLDKIFQNQYEDEYDTAELCENLMRWIGILGFFFLLLSVILSLVLRKNVLATLIPSFICYLTILIAAMIDCSKTEEILEDYFSYINLNANYSVHVGIWLPLAFVFVSIILAIIDRVQRKNMLMMINYN